ncbi:MAG: hypothetical protein ACYDHW_10800 [Syntrophorhabdaceae bacterium]
MAIETNGNGKSVTWKWLVGFLVTVLLLAAGGVMAGIQNEQARQALELRTLQREKVDKDQYCRDISEIKDSLKDIQRYVRSK